MVADARAGLFGACFIATLLLTTGCAQHITLGREAPIVPVPGSYTDVVRAHIYSKWGYPCILNPSTGGCEYKTATVVVEFGVHKDGRLGYVKVLKPSGYPTYDEHAIAAVKNAAPFPPIPDSFSLQGVRIDATMNYVVKQGQVEPPK